MDNHKIVEIKIIYRLCVIASSSPQHMWCVVGVVHHTRIKY
jgi:hypothetical protein